MFISSNINYNPYINYKIIILRLYFLNFKTSLEKNLFLDDLNYNNETRNLIARVETLFIENEHESSNIIKFIFDEFIENKSRTPKKEFDKIKIFITRCQKAFYLDIIKDYKYDIKYSEYYDKLNKSDNLLFKFLNYPELKNNKNLLFFSGLLAKDFVDDLNQSDDSNKDKLTPVERVMISSLIQSNILNDTEFLNNNNNDSI